MSSFENFPNQQERVESGAERFEAFQAQQERALSGVESGQKMAEVLKLVTAKTKELVDQDKFSEEQKSCFRQAA
jgi:hypothetical protein